MNMFLHCPKPRDSPTDLIKSDVSLETYSQKFYIAL
jgi:hypothetical protein